MASWTSPEGTLIVCTSKARTRRRPRRKRWTPRKIHRLLVANGLTPEIGSHLTVRVQDTYASQASASVAGSGSTYSSISATIYLKGVRSSFAYSPDSTIAHEYGHVWAYYHVYLGHNGDWTSYYEARGIAGDPRIDTTYAWDRDEIIAEDFRLLFGSDKAISQRPTHLNRDLPDPREVPGLREFLRDEWAIAP